MHATVEHNHADVRTASAAVAETPGAEFVIESLEIAEPLADEVVVRIAASGICHTDLIVRDGWRSVPFPVVVGHEGAGVVIEVGAAVRTIDVGDRVVLTVPSCRRCTECLSGRPFNCPYLIDNTFRCCREDGSTTLSRGSQQIGSPYCGQSSFATHAVVPAACVIRVESDLDFASLAPLGCGVSTGAGAVLNTAKPQPGSTIAVFGIGAVGMSAVMAAGVAGCTTIVAVDVNPSRLELALELGATHTIDAKAQDPVAAIKRIVPEGVLYAIEAAGHPKVLRQAVDSVAGMGMCVLTGNHPDGSELSLDIGDVSFNRALRGCVMGNAMPQAFIPTLIELHEHGRFPFDRMIERYPFSDINRAVSDAESGAVLKPVLVMPD